MRHPTPASTSQLQSDWYARLQMARAVAAYKAVVATMPKVETR